MLVPGGYFLRETKQKKDGNFRERKRVSTSLRIYPRPLANRRDREARRINRFRESGQASGEMEDTPEGDKKRKEGKKERGKGVRDKLAPARPNKK